MKIMYCIDDKGKLVDEFPFTKTELLFSNQENVDKYNKDIEDINKKLKPYRISKIVIDLLIMFILLACLIGISIIRNKEMENAAMLSLPCWIIAGVFLIALVILLPYYFKGKKIAKNYHAEVRAKNLEVYQAALEYFKVDVEHVYWMDILVLCHYKTDENGGYKFTWKSSYMTGRLYACYICKDETDLCLISDIDELRIPLDQITKIDYVRKGVSTNREDWSKQENPYDEKYKKYKAMGNQQGLLFIRGYYQLTIENPSDTYLLLIPCYEEENLKKMFGDRVPDYGWKKEIVEEKEAEK